LNCGKENPRHLLHQVEEESDKEDKEDERACQSKFRDLAVRATRLLRDPTPRKNAGLHPSEEAGRKGEKKRRERSLF